MEENKPNIRIIYVRHGESVGNIDESSYKKQGGDPAVALSQRGDQQADGAAKALNTYYSEQKIIKWPVVITSEYLRALQTAYRILARIMGLFPEPLEEQRYFADMRLNERHFGILPDLYTTNKKFLNLFVKDYKQDLLELSQDLFNRDTFNAAPPMGRSPDDQSFRVLQFVNNVLTPLIAQGERDFLIVGHGHGARALMKVLFNIPPQDWEKMHRFGNCDIIEITGQWDPLRLADGLSVRQIYDGEKMKTVSSNPIANTTPLSLKKIWPGHQPI